MVDKTEPDKSLDIYKATIFESRLDSSIFYQKPVDEVILVQESSDMKRPSTSSLSSSPSDLVYPRKKRLRTKKRVVIGKTHNKLEEAICTMAAFLRDSPTLPANPEDKRLPCPGVDKSVALPLKHCAFAGCAWHGAQAG